MRLVKWVHVRYSTKLLDHLLPQHGQFDKNRLMNKIIKNDTHIAVCSNWRHIILEHKNEDALHNHIPPTGLSSQIPMKAKTTLLTNFYF